MKKIKTKTIGVLMGGWSGEREISLQTGNAVCEALGRNGYRVVPIDCGRDLPYVLKEKKIDIAFIALHGRFGEDGCVQGMLEWMGIPYTGSRVLASSLCMDKAVLNPLVSTSGVILPKEVLYQEGVAIPFSPPWVVKPSREGSTINISIVEDAKNLAKAIAKAKESDTKILIQEYIQGHEVTVSVLCGKALPVIEIVPKSGFYDFESKYTKGKTDYLVPAPISEAATKKLQQISEKLFRELDCSGAARVDFILRGEIPYFLEVNTIPGLTETSLVPKAAKAVGISFDELVKTMLEDAK